MARPRPPIVAAADLARFLVAFGLAPLLLAPLGDGGRPWSFALTPTWTMGQLVFAAMAGLVLGAISGRPAQGLAAVALGSLLGLTADLWWLAGQITPSDRDFVTQLAATEWRSSLIGAALALIGTVSAGFLVGVVVARRVRDRPPGSRHRPTGAEAVAVGIAVVGAPLLALGIAAAAASSDLVVPDGAQIQMIVVSADAITVDPSVLRSEPTHFRCRYALDAAPVWAGLVADDGSTRGGDDLSACGFLPGGVTWGGIADLPPGRYVWTQVTMDESPRTITTSPVFVVAP